METSPTGHFPTKTFPQPDMFLTITYFQFFAFLAKLFVEANGLDFPLFFLGLLFYQYILFIHS